MGGLAGETAGFRFRRLIQATMGMSSIGWMLIVGMPSLPFGCCSGTVMLSACTGLKGMLNCRYEVLLLYGYDSEVPVNAIVPLLPSAACTAEVCCPAGMTDGWPGSGSTNPTSQPASQPTNCTCTDHQPTFPPSTSAEPHPYPWPILRDVRLGIN